MHEEEERHNEQNKGKEERENVYERRDMRKREEGGVASRSYRVDGELGRETKRRA